MICLMSRTPCVVGCIEHHPTVPMIVYVNRRIYAKPSIRWYMNCDSMFDNAFDYGFYYRGLAKHKIVIV